MRTRSLISLGWLLALALTVTPATVRSAGRPVYGGPAPKTDVAGARLLLPFYLVDTTDPAGVTTLFAIRNQLDAPAEVEVRYFQVDAPQAPQRIDVVTLAAKAVSTVNVRSVAGLAVDADGIARGYVVVEATTADAVLQGDYFRVTSNEDFASGFRMLNTDPASSHNDLCQIFTIRFLNGGGFDSGTRLIVWLEADQAPDPEQPVLAYFLYDQTGEVVLSNTFFADEVAFEVAVEDLFVAPLQEDFGAVELQFASTVGHVAGILSAEDRYSVGLEAFCGDL